MMKKANPFQDLLDQWDGAVERATLEKLREQELDSPNLNDVAGFQIRSGLRAGDAPDRTAVVTVFCTIKSKGCW